MCNSAYQNDLTCVSVYCDVRKASFARDDLHPNDIVHNNFNASKAEYVECMSHGVACRSKRIQNMHIMRLKAHMR